MILLVACILLLLAFSLHVLWWKIKMPLHATNALLLVFFIIVPVIWVIYSCLPRSSIIVSFHEIIRLMLLYSSCSLVYIILYSAIEQQSPTLAIIDYIFKHKTTGCSDVSLRKHLSADNEIKKRLMLMQQGGWLVLIDDRWHLTKKGTYIGRFFEVSAIIFCLKMGG